MMTAQDRGATEALPSATTNRFWRFGAWLGVVVALEAFGFETHLVGSNTVHQRLTPESCLDRK